MKDSQNEISGFELNLTADGDNGRGGVIKLNGENVDNVRSIVLTSSIDEITILTITYNCLKPTPAIGRAKVVHVCPLDYHDGE